MDLVILTFGQVNEVDAGLWLGPSFQENKHRP